MERVSYAVSLLFHHMVGDAHGSVQRALLDHQHAEQRYGKAQRGRREDTTAGAGGAPAAMKTQWKAGARSLWPAEIFSSVVTSGPSPMPPSTMAPNIATTSAPPSVRKKFSVPVAVPSWCGLTTVCMTVVETGYIGPTPKPSTNSNATTVPSVCPAGSAASAPSAAMATTRPRIGTRM